MLRGQQSETRCGALDRLRDPRPAAFLVRGIGLGRVLLVGGMILTAARPPDGDHRRAGGDSPYRTRSAKAPTRRLDEVAGRLAAGALRRFRDRDRLDPRAPVGSARPRRCCFSRSAHVRLLQPDDHGRLHRPSGADLSVDRASQEEFRTLAAAGIIVLLAILLSLNAFAIWLRSCADEGGDGAPPGDGPYHAGETASVASSVASMLLNIGAPCSPACHRP